MTVLVGDSSALIALAVCDGLGLLEQLFDEIRVPETVFQEVAVAGRPHAEKLRDFLEPRVARGSAPSLPRTGTGLGTGEKEAIGLCKQLGEAILLADDLEARKSARRAGIPVVGSLGVLLRSKEAGLREEIGSLLDRLDASDVYFGRRLIQRVR